MKPAVQVMTMRGKTPPKNQHSPEGPTVKHSGVEAPFNSTRRSVIFIHRTMKLRLLQDVSTPLHMIIG